MTLAELRALATVPDDGWHRWPEPHRHAAVTLEEADLLYALVRATQPALVVELGTGMGISGRFIAEALREVGNGRLITVEPLVGLLYGAEEIFKDYSNVTVTHPDRLSLDATPDLVYIDSGKDRRAADIASWVGAMSPALLVVHDAFRDYEGLRGASGVVVPTAGGMWVGRA